MSYMEANGERPRGKYWSEMTEEERREFIERARRELPGLKADIRKSRENLQRIARGQRPIRH
jgi:hypothetical protein